MKKIIKVEILKRFLISLIIIFFLNDIIFIYILNYHIDHFKTVITTVIIIIDRFNIQLIVMKM